MLDMLYYLVNYSSSNTITMSTYYKQFGLTQQKTIDLFSQAVTHIIHDGLCPGCGNHVAPLPALDATIKNLNSYAITDAEKGYVTFLTGTLLHQPTFWEAFMQYKCTNKETTLVAVREVIRDYVLGINAPLN